MMPVLPLVPSRRRVFVHFHAGPVRSRGRVRSRAGVIALVVWCLAVLFAPSQALAAGNELFGGAVTPGAGTTTTSFTFQVGFSSSPARNAESVRAEIVGAGVTLDLALTDGTAAAGTWAGSTTLPAGTWSVRFSAAVAQGNQPNLTLSNAVVVTQATPPPTPTATAPPPSTAPPTPRPTATPSPRTPRPTPRATETPSASATASSSGSPAASGTAVASPTAGTTLGAAGSALPTTTASTTVAPGSPSPGTAVTAGRPGTSSPSESVDAQPAESAGPMPDPPDVAPARGSASRNALLLLGGSISVLGAAMLARLWITRRGR